MARTSVDPDAGPRAIAAGQTHTCALLHTRRSVSVYAGGDFVCWGEAGYGQLGSGNSETYGADLRNPQPTTLNPKPCTLNPKPQTLNPQPCNPETLNPVTTEW